MLCVYRYRIDDHPILSYPMVSHQQDWYHSPAHARAVLRLCLKARDTSAAPNTGAPTVEVPSDLRLGIKVKAIKVPPFLQLAQAGECLSCVRICCIPGTVMTTASLLVDT